VIVFKSSFISLYLKDLLEEKDFFSPQNDFYKKIRYKTFSQICMKNVNILDFPKPIMAMSEEARIEIDQLLS